MIPANSFHYGYSQIYPTRAVTYDFDPPFLRPWVARVTGICKDYGYKRDFVSKIVKSFPDRQDVKEISFDFEIGYLYEYRNFMVEHLNKVTVDGHFASTHQGLLELEKEQVRTLLHMPVKDWTKERKTERKGYAHNELEF